MTRKKPIKKTEEAQQSQPVMLEEMSWKEFQESGLLWLVNMNLHLLGLAIALNVDKETGEILGAFPAKCKFRGFDEVSNTNGYAKVSDYILANAERIKKEAYE